MVQAGAESGPTQPKIMDTDGLKFEVEICSQSFKLMLNWRLKLIFLTVEVYVWAWRWKLKFDFLSWS